MENETYNGWTNYATWKVNLELIDAESYEDMGITDTYELAEIIKEDVEIHISESSEDGSVAQSYALAFISDVNWYEIAEHITNEIEE